MKCLEREDCVDEACRGHCPKCASNQIGGGGCNGMFCSACSHNWDHDPDDDLASLDREALLREVVRLRAGIRAHRDSTGHNLCWYRPELWGLLPEKTSPSIDVPDWPQFMRGCIQYRTSLDHQAPDVARSADEFKDTAAP